MDPFYLQPRQMEFATTDADICVFGGAAGGGKTRALIYDPIAKGHYENPGFGGIIFRENFPEIDEVGGPWDEATSIYPWLGARGIIGHHEWRFPSGAKMGFRHLDNEEAKYKYKGSQICYLAFDEVDRISESRFWYLTSRNRSTCGIRPYIRATCNPSPGWLKTNLLAPWVDRAYQGRRAESAEIRWVKRNAEGKIEWFEAPVENAYSLTFIRSKLTDNPALLEKDPYYLQKLLNLPTVERERLLNGNWDVRREGLVFPDFEKCIIESVPERLDRLDGNQDYAAGGIDFGWNNPFAAVWGYLDQDDVLWITGVRHKSGNTLPEHSVTLPRGVRWWCDPAQPGLIAELINSGHDAISCKHKAGTSAAGAKRNPQLDGIDKLASRMRPDSRGETRLKIVRSSCLPLLNELAMYHYDPEKTEEVPVKEHDHACDALRYLCVGLDRGRSVAPLEALAPAKDVRDAALWQ